MEKNGGDKKSLGEKPPLLGQISKKIRPYTGRGGIRPKRRLVPGDGLTLKNLGNNRTGKGMARRSRETERASLLYNATTGRRVIKGEVLKTGGEKPAGRPPDKTERPENCTQGLRPVPKVGQDVKMLRGRENRI